jgi:hypothetical protein
LIQCLPSSGRCFAFVRPADLPSSGCRFTFVSFSRWVGDELENLFVEWWGGETVLVLLVGWGTIVGSPRSPASINEGVSSGTTRPLFPWGGCSRITLPISDHLAFLPHRTLPFALSSFSSRFRVRSLFQCLRRAVVLPRRAVFAFVRPAYLASGRHCFAFVGRRIPLFLIASLPRLCLHLHRLAVRT